MPDRQHADCFTAVQFKPIRLTIEAVIAAALTAELEVIEGRNLLGWNQDRLNCKETRAQTFDWQDGAVATQLLPEWFSALICHPMGIRDPFPTEWNTQAHTQSELQLS